MQLLYTPFCNFASIKLQNDFLFFQKPGNLRDFMTFYDRKNAESGRFIVLKQSKAVHLAQLPERLAGFFLRFADLCTWGVKMCTTQGKGGKKPPFFRVFFGNLFVQQRIAPPPFCRWRRGFWGLINGYP